MEYAEFTSRNGATVKITDEDRGGLWPKYEATIRRLGGEIIKGHANPALLPKWVMCDGEPSEIEGYAYVWMVHTDDGRVFGVPHGSAGDAFQAA